MRHRLVIVQEAGSTQDLARDAALQGEPEGYAVMAYAQTGGRGRSGRIWKSPPGRNLALSVLLRPTIRLEETPLLGLLASIAVVETVESLGVANARLKWPNDVLADGRKISGILPEARFANGIIDYLIIGIGLNVSSGREDFPAELQGLVTSVCEHTETVPDLPSIAESLLTRMDALYAKATSEGCGFVVPMWTERWAHRGRRLTRDGQEGVAEGLSPTGALLLRTDGGSLIEIISGEAPPVP